MRSLDGRVSKLEGVSRLRDPPTRWVQVIARSGETNDEAIARYRCETGDESDDLSFIIIVPVAPGDRDCFAPAKDRSLSV
jgi:hypothetical protein